MSIQSDHDAPATATAVAQPLVEVAPTQRRSPAEEARTLVARSTTATLATTSDDGGAWASLVAYGELEDGSPVLLVSTLAEHGRNLPERPRASMCVAERVDEGDVLDCGRVTLAGSAERPEGAERDSALAAFRIAHPAARVYAGFGDFSCFVLRVERVRWVGGYGRMDSADATSYRMAEPDPVAASAPYAARHMNSDHADALLVMAQNLGGFPDAERAVCKRADRYGIDLWVSTPRGGGPCRVDFAEPCTEPDGLRAAAVELTRRARAE